MDKNLLCLILTLILGVKVAFAEIEHTVSRGETLESIAEKYGLTVEKLLEVNEDASTLFYIGQKLVVPNILISDQNQLTDNNMNVESAIITSRELELSEDAKRYFTNKEWGKAVKIYSKLIKYYPRSIYYYNRAISQMNNNKNRQAANDFKQALSMTDCTSTMHENGPGLLAEAERRHSEWKEQQMNVIGSAILGVAAVGLTTWAAVESSKIESASNSNMNTAMSGISLQESNMNNAGDASSNYDRGNEVITGSKKKQRCGVCGGKGNVIKYVANYGIDKQPWCDECGKHVVSGHYHATCTYCNGKGER